MQWQSGGMDTGFDKAASAGYLANIMARLFARHLEAQIKPLGLGIGAFPALLFLWDEDGLTQKDLVQRLGVEQPTIANTLIRMERDGLVTRRRDRDDARVQRIWLTRKGRGLEGAAVAAARAVNGAALANLTAAEREGFLEAMNRVITTLQGDAEKFP